MRIDLEAYLKRIELPDATADLNGLHQVHLHHATRIPFENLDIQLGIPISLNLDDLQRKLVGMKRGGYCFEQNTLFQAMLNQIGFQVIACEARVRMGRSLITPRTHMLLITKIEGEKYLCDVGFGGDGLLLPVPMNGIESKQYLWTYRVVQEGSLHVLQALAPQGWLDLYSFAAEAREPVDFEVANWYTSTHPQSRFVQTLTAQRPDPEGRYILRNKTFTVDRGGPQDVMEIESPSQLLEILHKYFYLDFPAGTRFRNPFNYG